MQHQHSVLCSSFISTCWDILSLDFNIHIFIQLLLMFLAIAIQFIH